MAQTAKKLNKTTNLQVKTLVKQLKELNSGHAKQLFEMGRICSAISSNYLFRTAGYTTIAEFCDKELDFGYATFRIRARLYDDFDSLGYNEKEAIRIIEAFPLGELSLTLRDMEKKISMRMLKKRIESKESLYIKGKINVMFTSEREEKMLERELEKYGMTYSDNGSRIGVTESMIKLVREHKKLTSGLKSVK